MKTKARTLADFPAWVDANEKLTTLQEQRAEAERTFREAASAPSLSQQAMIEADAQAMIAGTVAVASPDLAELQRQRDTLTRAVALQAQQLEQERDAAAREITADNVPRYRDALQKFLAAQQSSLDAYENLLRVVAETNAACGGTCFLPTYNMPPDLWARMKIRFPEFAAMARGWLNATGGAK